MKFSPQNERQFAVVGLGRFGRNIAKSLHEMGYDVLAIDKDMEKVQDFSHEVTHVVQADTTDEEALRSLGILNFDVVIVAIGDDTEANIIIDHMTENTWQINWSEIDLLNSLEKKELKRAY